MDAVYAGICIYGNTDNRRRSVPDPNGIAGHDGHRFPNNDGRNEANNSIEIIYHHVFDDVLATLVYHSV